MGSIETVPENSAVYYGVKDDAGYRYDLLSKMNIVINAIKNSDILKKAFIEKRLLLATSNFVFTISFVAYDLFHTNTCHSKIKITFYQHGERQTGNLPCVMLDSSKNIKDMYPYFQNVINKQWNTSENIKDETALELFSNELLNALKNCKNDA